MLQVAGILEHKRPGRWHLTGSALVAALFLCLLLYRARSFMPPGSLGEGPASGSEAGQPLFSYVVMSSSHKTGTVQLMCLARVVRDVAHVALSAHMGNATSADVAAAAAAAKSRPGNPAVLMSVLPLNQDCYGRADSDGGAAFRCPRPDVPCTPEGAPLLGLDGCFMHLPAAHSGALGFVHFVRNPWDAVISAYWYHLQTPAPETWIDKPLSTRLGMMQEAGVPDGQLQALGIGEEQAALSYGDVLRALPEEAGVQLEFWRSAEGLYAMARQFLVLRHQPTALQLPYEGAQAAFNDTVERIAGQFWPQHAERMLEAAQQCDPTTWSAAQLAADNHVTAVKHSAADRRRLRGVLAAQPETRRHLCVLAEALGYVADPLCKQQQAQQAQRPQGRPEVGPAQVEG